MVQTMEYSVPHRVVYQTEDPIPVSEVVQSLIANERLLQELKPFLEACVPGLVIEVIRVTVRDISQASPLREILIATMLVTFQQDLAKEVPQLVEKLFGLPVTDQYDSLVTVVFCALVLYGIDFVYKKINKVTESNKIARQLDGLIRDVAADTGVSEDRIRKIIQEKYAKNKLNMLARSALQFFMPSRRHRNAPVLVGERKISSDIIAEIPSEAQIEDFQDDEASEILENVEIELHAQDVDRTKTGWAGVVPSISKRRMRMEVYPPVRPQDIYTKERIRGDVIVVSKRKDSGEFEPTVIHLIRVRD